MIKIFSKNIVIIKKAYDLFHDGDFIRKKTIELSCSDFKGVNKKDFSLVCDLFKAIRQDFTKIMVTMNCIDRNYKMYQNNQFPSSYFSLMNCAVTQEIGCQIEYLFAKYRVIIEYLFKILEKLVVPLLSVQEKKEYASIKKDTVKKSEWITEYIAKSSPNKCNDMNIEWFQNLRKTRNAIVHNGASCLVFSDKKQLLFNVYTLDGLEKGMEQIQWDDYYKVDNDLVRYDRYWGLYFAKLIVFSNYVFDFFGSISILPEDRKLAIETFGINNTTSFVDPETGEDIPDVRTIPGILLKNLIGESVISFCIKKHT